VDILGSLAGLAEGRFRVPIRIAEELIGQQKLVWEVEALEKLFKGPEAEELVAAATKHLEESVISCTPVHSGAHAAAVFSETWKDEDGVPVGAVATTSPTWHLLEYGSVNSPIYRPFTAGLERSGLIVVLQGEELPGD
jgi:hypothetical protein